ncbi:DUF559 domain-containing protein [Mycobacterium sp. AMU20-3851]|uniref:DUF559 domain-containing protein n=1 Tax=Mycobacterium sp. AMU20-3851 TaxID=3122055 RepID=UPI003754F6BD
MTPFVGSEAVAAGRISKYRLRTRFTAIFPDVYVPNDADLTFDDRALAAWLWSRRKAVLCGLTASALHGARYIEDSLPVELVYPSRRPPLGIRTYSHQVHADEITDAGRWGLPVTSIERTVFDLGRRAPLEEAVARLDALGNARYFRAAEVLDRARSRHGGKRGIRQLQTALDLHDPGAESPRESWLRLLIIGAGYPRPRTQIPVVSADGRRKYFLDMGWEDFKLAVEYDGDHHRTSPAQFAHDIVRTEDLDELGWHRLRVAKRHGERVILDRLARAWAARVHSDPKFHRKSDLSAPSAHKTEARGPAA